MATDNHIKQLREQIEKAADAVIETYCMAAVLKRALNGADESVVADRLVNELEAAFEILADIAWGDEDSLDMQALKDYIESFNSCPSGISNKLAHLIARHGERGDAVVKQAMADKLSLEEIVRMLSGPRLVWARAQ